MGRGMDALRVWTEASDRPRLLVSSLDAMLKRIPLPSIIESGRRIDGRQAFDRRAFETFVRSTGYCAKKRPKRPSVPSSTSGSRVSYRTITCPIPLSGSIYMRDCCVRIP